MELNKKQIEFLNDSTKDPWTGVSIGVWTINEKTGLVDIKGNFDCGRRGESSFKGIKFGVVTGNFDCGSCWFYGTLEGAPQEVGGNFDCSNSVIKSLEGAPRRVGGNFDCSGNNFKNLKGAPKEVGGNFICTRGYSRGKLTSLKGAPKEVGGDFNCSYNSLKSLVGAPQKVGGDFNCESNFIKSLVGAPKEVGGDFNCSHNSLKSLVGAPQEVGGNFVSRNNEIAKWLSDRIYEIMKNSVNLRIGLALIKKEILDAKQKEIDSINSKYDTFLIEDEDLVKGVSMLNNFGHFD